MCDTCGCNITDGNRYLLEGDGKLARTESGREAVQVLEGLLSENDHVAAHNREHFDRHGVLAINLMSSPGSGKTRLLEETITALGDELRIAVVEGDLETENDAQRIRDKGVNAVQITTGTACHLDAHMVHGALHAVDLDDVDILFIENVGNLVCPASFDLGQHRNVTLLSVTEGDDKPAKYPVIFRAADLVLISKADLLPVLDDFSPSKAEGHLRQLASAAPLIALSAKSGVGLDDWLAWLREAREAVAAKVADGATVRPAIQPEGQQLHAHPHHHAHTHD
ncbi:hydrogenase nickel incorporation protein HypB [Thiosocius teredinicola]|uniref:hydrogenase nickel incorporation protein HypB n=1 Tax=Thiosocius teredinicola TaxID=1973002 RepID=UPI0009913F5B